MDEDTKIEDGEIVEDDKPVVAESGDATVVMSLIEMIKNTLIALDREGGKLKEMKQMLEDSFKNDATYKQHDDEVKKATKVKQATKAQISKQPQIAQLTEKVKELAKELKEKKISLNDYASEYHRLTGATTIEGPNGEILDIVNEVKLVRQKSGK